MTSEKMLEMVMQIYNRMTVVEQQDVENYLKISKDITDGTFQNWIGSTATMSGIVGEIIRVLKQDIINVENKKNGKSKQAAVIKSVIKTAQKYYKNKKEWHTSYIVDGKQYVADGHRMFIFSNPVEGVPISEPDKAVTREITDIAQGVPLSVFTGILDVPDRAKLAVYIKAEKAKKKQMFKNMRNVPPIMFNFGEGKPIVNAEYLLDVIDGIPDVELKYNENHLNYAMHGKGTNGSVIILPLNKNTCHINEDVRTEL